MGGSYLHHSRPLTCSSMCLKLGIDVLSHHCSSRCNSLLIHLCAAGQDESESHLDADKQSPTRHGLRPRLLGASPATSTFAARSQRRRARPVAATNAFEFEVNQKSHHNLLLRLIRNRTHSQLAKPLKILRDIHTYTHKLCFFTPPHYPMRLPLYW